MQEESRIQERAAGATKVTEADLKGKIIEYAWWMKKRGYSPYTIKCNTAVLMILAKRGANLYDPESVKETIAQQDTWQNRSKMFIVAAYDLFARMMNIAWGAPDYRWTPKIPFIPLESEIDQLIAGCGKKLATFLQALKETGARSGEMRQLKWIDIDLVNNTLTINNPGKGSNPRMFKVSTKLIAMLNALPKTSENVFEGGSLISFRRNLQRQRRRIARKLQNPRLMQIHFHTLRHWKATMEYHRTKDILHVKEMLGHKRIDNTLIYTQLITFENDDFHVKVAKTLKEACELVETGFDYVTTIEGAQVFRKRK